MVYGKARMDVGCPKCQSEYELEDARVPDEGVTVKCTSCQHVFRVKRKSLVVTLPAKPSEVAQELPPPPPSREWKVRQNGGGQFTCRELTTLQKWIIEGKVSRDAEISLTGETWKRLGDIPELASFFQVVDDAARARAWEAQRTSSSPSLPVVPPPPPPPSVPPLSRTDQVEQLYPEATGTDRFAAQRAEPATGPVDPRITETWRAPGFSARVPAPETARLEVVTQPEVAAVAPDHLRQTLRDPAFSPPAPRTVEPPRSYEPTDSQLARAARGGGSSGRTRWAVLVLGGLLLGGGVGYYFGVYQPEQLRLGAALGQPPTVTPSPVEAVVPPPPVVPVVIDAAVEFDAGALDLPDAGAVGVDAGAPAVLLPDAGPDIVDAGANAGAAAPVDAGPPRRVTFDGLLAQADRLRDNGHPEAALDVYGRAHDLKPTRIEPLAGRGLTLLDMGNTLAAEAQFEQALQLNDRYGPAIMGLAEAFRLQGKNARAVEFYQRYLDVSPNGSEAAVARNNIERLKK